MWSTAIGELRAASATTPPSAVTPGKGKKVDFGQLGRLQVPPPCRGEFRKFKHIQGNGMRLFLSLPGHNPGGKS